MKRLLKKMLVFVAMFAVIATSNFAADCVKIKKDNNVYDENIMSCDNEDYINELIVKAEATNFDDTTELEKYVTIHSEDTTDFTTYTMTDREPSQKFVDDTGLTHSVYKVRSTVLAKVEVDESNKYESIKDVGSYSTGPSGARQVVVRYWFNVDSISPNSNNSYYTYKRIYSLSGEAVQNSYGIRATKLTIFDGKEAGNWVYKVNTGKEECKAHETEFKGYVNLGEYGKINSRKVSINDNIYYRFDAAGNYAKAGLKMKYVDAYGKTGTTTILKSSVVAGSVM